MMDNSSGLVMMNYMSLGRWKKSARKVKQNDMIYETRHQAITADYWTPSNLGVLDF